MKHLDAPEWANRFLELSTLDRSSPKSETDRADANTEVPPRLDDAAESLRRLHAAAALVALLGSACGPAHINAYEPKRREYEPIVAKEVEDSPREDGSLWTSGADSNSLVTDVRAFRANDLVTVFVEELASAKRSTDTQVDRDGSFNFSGDVAGVLENAGIDPDKLASLRSGTSHDASGRTSRRDDVRFQVSATVTKVLPNGNLFLEGHRVVLVNNEEHHFYISGVARPVDIRTDNSISSIQLADAEVEFVGDGVLSEGQKPGWLTRLLNYINPL